MAPTKPPSHLSGVNRRYRPRELELAEGGRLILHGNGSISQTDAAGETLGTWATGDPDWARHAIQFGLVPHPETVAPHGRRVAEPRPQGG